MHFAFHILPTAFAHYSVYYLSTAHCAVTYHIISFALLCVPSQYLSPSSKAINAIMLSTLFFSTYIVDIEYPIVAWIFKPQFKPHTRTKGQNRQQCKVSIQCRYYDILNKQTKYIFDKNMCHVEIFNPRILPSSPLLSFPLQPRLLLQSIPIV